MFLRTAVRQFRSQQISVERRAATSSANCRFNCVVDSSFLIANRKKIFAEAESAKIDNLIKSGDGNVLSG